MVPLLRRRQLQTRSALVAFLLVLTLGLAGVMAYQAWDASRSHQRIAETALEEHALSAAWQLSSAVRRDLYVHFLGPGLEVVARGGGTDPDIPMKEWPSILKTGEDFGWPFWKEGMDFAFRLNLKTGVLETRGNAPADRDLLNKLRALLKEEAGTGPDGLKKLPMGIRVLDEGGKAKLLVFGIHPETGPMAEVAFGFQTTLAPLMVVAEEIEAKTPLLPPALTRGEPMAKILSFNLYGPDGDVVYRSTPQYTSGLEATDTVGAMYGGFTGTVRLSPKAADVLVIGGLPRSRLPTLLGLLALTSALVVVAMFQLRREQELGLLRTDFVSSVSHQLRTPLAQIRMFGETLLLGRVRSEEESRKSLEIIVKEAQRLTHQVDNVLHFSRSQRGEVALNPEEMELAPLVEEVLESFSPLAEAQDCRLEASLDETLMARVDQAATRQILLNLLENAVKYGPPDQIVDVRLRKGTPGTVQLVVEDQGKGIPADKRDEVFHPYSRLERDRESGVAGSGIGLAVVRELVTRQGGRVWVEGSSGGGARFVVSLPGGRGWSVPRSREAGSPKSED